MREYSKVGSALCAAAVRPLVRACVDGIRRGVSPRPEKEGHGGTYFFRGTYVRLPGSVECGVVANHKLRMTLLVKHGTPRALFERARERARERTGQGGVSTTSLEFPICLSIDVLVILTCRERRGPRLDLGPSYNKRAHSSKRNARSPLNHVFTV